MAVLKFGSVIAYLLFNGEFLNALKATPRPKPRAFPRTNPYVGVTRTDGFSTCQRGNEPHLYQHQAAYDMYAGQPVVGAGIGPATTMNVEYSTLRSHRPSTSQSLNIGDPSYYATVIILPSAVSILDPSTLFPDSSMRLICDE